MHPQILPMLDLLLSASAVGATLWFFFVQSPVLIRWMGRDRFVPIQMKLTRVLFRVLTALLALLVALALVQRQGPLGPLQWGAIVALIGASVNSFFVVPRALRAGAQGRKETRARGDDGSVGAFVSEGTGPSAKIWHRTVVAFVIVMLGGLLPHMAALLPAERSEVHAGHRLHDAPVVSASVHHHHGAAERSELRLDDGRRWKADATTTAGVRKLQSQVEAALHRGREHAASGSAAASELRAAYSDIYRKCTMQGAAHEQLHTFLVPIDRELSVLGQLSGDAADETLRRMQQHLQRYDAFFE